MEKGGLHSTAAFCAAARPGFGFAAPQMTSPLVQSQTPNQGTSSGPGWPQHCKLGAAWHRSSSGAGKWAVQCLLGGGVAAKRRTSTLSHHAFPPAASAAPPPLRPPSYLPQSVSVQLHRQARRGTSQPPAPNYALVARHHHQLDGPRFDHFRFPLYPFSPRLDRGRNVFAPKQHSLPQLAHLCFNHDHQLRRFSIDSNRTDSHDYPTTFAALDRRDLQIVRRRKYRIGNNASYLNRSHHSMSLDRLAESKQSTPSPTMSSTTTTSYSN